MVKSINVIISGWFFKITNRLLIYIMLNKIIKLSSVLAVMLFLLAPAIGQAAESVDVYFFYSKTCPHCAKEEIFLDQLEEEYGDRINIHRYEATTNKENYDLFVEYIKSSGKRVDGVPATFIGEEVIVGYRSDNDTGQRIRQAIDSNLGEIGNQKKSALVIDIPLIGETDLSQYSLFGLTVVIAAIDGFNPCAMWVLLILIGMLLGMQRRGRMWFLGLSFIAASAFVYFIFLAAWLEFFSFVGVVRWIQIVIGLLALGVGVFYLNRFRKMKPGECEVVNPEQRRKLSERIKRIVRERALWLALIGIVSVAFVVNLIELACSAGLPAIYTQVMSLSDLTRWEYYLYLLLYIVIFMLDDMLVFIIAMVTMKAVGTTGKFSRYATLIGGVVILLLGLLLIFKPGWVMLG